MYVVWWYRPDRRVQRYRPGWRAQRAMTGPEGPTSYGTGGSRWDTSTGGSYYSLEWRMCCMWYFRELTKHLCLQLLCDVFQVPVMSAGRRRHDPYTLEEFMFWILGRCLCDKYNWNNMLMLFCEKWLFWKWKICFENLRCYKLVSEPWFEGFRHTLWCVWTQTEDLRKNFIK